MPSIKSLAEPGTASRPSPQPQLAGPKIGQEWAAATISTRSHLHYALALASSFVRHHPSTPIVLLVVDGIAADRDLKTSARILLADDLRFPEPYDLLKLERAELCCAAKPVLIGALLDAGFDRVVYLDGDQYVFAPLTDLLQPLDRADLVLVPHMRAPFPQAGREWERPQLEDMSRAGLVNAGILAVKGSDEGRRAMRLWESTLRSPGAFAACRGEVPDQHALSWLLAFADRVHLLRDPTVNVAYWNLHERSLDVEDWSDDEPLAARWSTENRPLATFHFSGFDPAARFHLSRHDGRHSTWSHPALSRLLRFYAGELQAHGATHWPQRTTPCDAFPSGVPIDARMKAIFKEQEALLWSALDPFSPAGEQLYCRSLLTPSPRGPSLLPILLDRIYEERADLRQAFPAARVEPGALLSWFAATGADETGYQLLFDLHRPTIPSAEGLRLLGRLAERKRHLMGWTSECLTTHRREFIERLEAGGEAELARRVRHLECERWALSPIWLVRELFQTRKDLDTRYPDPLYADSEDVLAWILECGIPLDFLPTTTGEAFNRVCRGGALARITSFLCRSEHLAREAPTRLCGLQAAEFAALLLFALADQPEFTLDDVVTYLWTMEKTPWRGLRCALELLRRFPDRDSAESSVEEQNRRLAPLLQSPDPRVRLQLEAIRRDEPELGDPPSLRPSTASVWASFDHQAEAPSTNPGLTRPGVNCFGYFLSPNGLGVWSRNTELSLRAADLPTGRVPTMFHLVDHGVREQDLVSRFDASLDTNVFISFPHQETDRLRATPRSQTRGRRNIAYLAWEAEGGNPDWRRVYDRYDEVWALSSFAADSLSHVLARPVSVLPCAVDLDVLPPSRRAPFGWSERFTVLYVFDAGSSIERKNPEGAIAAFARAFRADDPVRLILRASHGDRREHLDRVRALERRAAATGLDVRIVTRPLDRDQILSVISACDCYMSLHRAEGFGYTAAEAMAYGRPVIATGYSGNLDFMDDSTALLVRATQTTVRVPDGPFRRGMVWSEPDTTHAAELLRYVFENPGDAARLGERARSHVHRLLHPRIVGLEARRLLGLPAPSPAVGADSSAAESLSPPIPFPMQRQKQEVLT
ncbi:MAG: glycosyltransferase [Acidobacteriota bacterium]